MKEVAPKQCIASLCFFLLLLRFCLFVGCFYCFYVVAFFVVIIVGFFSFLLVVLSFTIMVPFLVERDSVMNVS